MAHAYHLEALRKQRAIDRAYHARLRLEQTQLEASQSQKAAATSPVTSPQRPGAPEPPTATPVSGETTAQRTSRPGSRESSRPASKQSSRPTSQSGSRPLSQHGSRPPSQHGSRPPSQQSSRPPSRPSSQQQASRTSEMSPLDKSLNAVAKDLHKKELVLRDSNLVMGHISPQEVLEAMAE